jgi:hypothetical protein
MSVFKIAAGVTVLAFGAALVTAISGTSAEVKDSIITTPVAAPLASPVVEPAPLALPLAAKNDGIRSNGFKSNAIKPERIDVRPDASACPQEPWPFGCVWRGTPTRRVARSTRPL